MALFLNLPEGTELRGSLDFNALPVELMARRGIFHSQSTPATNYAGRYTLLLPGPADGKLAPIGNGYAPMTVTAGGAPSPVGVRADGTAFSQSVPASPGGDWPLFASPSRGRGLLAGNLRVDRPWMRAATST